MEKVKNKYFIIQWLKSLLAILPIAILTFGLVRDDLRIRFKDCLYGVSGVENAAESCGGVYGGLFYTYGFHIYFFLFLLVSSGIIYFFYRKYARNNRWFYLKKIFLPAMMIFISVQIFYSFIDFYNFWQFKKALPILESISKDTPEFFDIKEFNEKYNTNITPINKCYDISTYNGSELYDFSFRIESLIYTSLYGTKYFVYPKYDIPYISICAWYCYNENLRSFKELVSHRCEE